MGKLAEQVPLVYQAHPGLVRLAGVIIDYLLLATLSSNLRAARGLHCPVEKLMGGLARGFRTMSA